MSRVAIIAALRREVAFLIRSRGWRPAGVVGHGYRSYESEQALVLCAGIGPRPARQAAEDVIATVRPSVLVSAGLAGAVTPDWRVGQVMLPATIIDAGHDTAVDLKLPRGHRELRCGGVLVTASRIAGSGAKRLVAAAYDANAVDMEAAPVAEIAAAHGIPFLAVKAISDEYNFPMPELAPYIDYRGRFLTSRFVMHTVFHPSTWSVVRKLASNSRIASQALCRVLRTLVESGALSAVPAPTVSSGVTRTRQVERPLP